MLDHRDPAVVRILGVRELAGRVGRFLVEFAEFDLLELVVLVVDHRAMKRHRRHRILRALGLRIAGELVVRERRDRRRAGIRDVVGDVDHVSAAVERQHLHDAIAVRRHRLQPQIDAIGASLEFARTRFGCVDSAMVGHSLTEETRLCDERPLGRPQEREVGFRLVTGIVILEEGDLRDLAPGGIDLRAIEVGDDGDRASWRGRRLSTPGPWALPVTRRLRKAAPTGVRASAAGRSRRSISPASTPPPAAAAGILSATPPTASAPRRKKRRTE